MLRNLVKRVLAEMFEQKTKSTFYTIPERIKTQNFYESMGHVKYLSILAAAIGYISYSLYDKNKVAHASDLLKDRWKYVNNPKLPIYKRSDVAKHKTIEDRIWITYLDGVYDITDYIHKHPGGDQILLAAGEAVDPFWMVYTYHKTKENLDILEEYRIGTLDASEVYDSTSDMGNPFPNEPERHPMLLPFSQVPFNASPAPDVLISKFITPNELFYVRNHLAVPAIDLKTYHIEIEIEGKPGTICLTLDDIKKKFKKRSVMATLTCSGNRRDEMSKVKKVQGLAWSKCAISNAVWSGASLREVLYSAGLNESDINRLKYVQFEGHDTDAGGQCYNASIPIWKATECKGEALLAYEMNGEPLPVDHGFPLRLIAPGIAGARHVKWLGKIIVSSEESKGHWQRQDYKGFSPSTDFHNVDFTKARAIQEYPVTSAICVPENNTTVRPHNGRITVKGYAYSGGGNKIIRVDVTGDGGKTWHTASLDHFDTAAESPKHWSWTLWSCEVPVENCGKIQVWAKAVDTQYHVQPEYFKNVYNFRGVLNNAYHRVDIKLS